MRFRPCLGCLDLCKFEDVPLHRLTLLAPANNSGGRAGSDAATQTRSFRHRWAPPLPPYCACTTSQWPRWPAVRRRVELWANGAVGRTSARARPCASSPRPPPTPARPRRAAAAVQAAQPRTLTVRFGRRHKPTHSKRVHARARTRAAARSDQCIAQPTSGGIGGGARACSASAGFNLCLCLRWECACWRWCGWAASSW